MIRILAPALPCSSAFSTLRIGTLSTDISMNSAPAESCDGSTMITLFRVIVPLETRFDPVRSPFITRNTVRARRINALPEMRDLSFWIASYFKGPDCQ